MYTTDVVVDTFAFLQSKNERQAQQPQTQQVQQAPQQFQQQTQQTQAQRTVGINPVITPEQAYDQNTQF